MVTIDWRDYISSDPAILGGKPVLKGTRLSVEFVLELLAAGWGSESLRASYPNLTDDRIRAVLAYADVHRLQPRPVPSNPDCMS